MSGIFSTISSLFTVDPARRDPSGVHRSASQESSRPIVFDRFTEVLSQRGMPYEAIATLFRTIDADGDGKVTRADMQRMLQQFEQTKHVRSVDGTQETATASGDGQQQRPRSATVDESAVRSTLADLQQRAATYSRNGARSFIAKGTFFNAFA